MWKKELSRFAARVEKKFRQYFVGFGARKKGKVHLVNVIFDDRDVKRMAKKDLVVVLQKHINKLNSAPNLIKAKPVLVSDISEKNVWNLLGDFSQIMDVKSMITFINIKLPEGFQDAFDKLPEQFKLEDFARELKQISGKEYHRNTYQNWLRFLKNSGFVELKNKTYCKILGEYKKTQLKELT